MSHIIEVCPGAHHDGMFILFLPKQLLEELSIRDNSSKSIFFGTKEIYCTIKAAEEDNIQKCSLSSTAWDALCFPFPVALTINYNGTDSLYFGPLIGIFTAGFTGSSLRPVGERSFLFAKYINAAKHTGALAVVFGSHHIHWEEGFVEGYTFSETGWNKIKVPLPNVVYDRLPNRKTEEHPAYFDIKERLQKEYRIPWFNPGFFDKWDIYRQLVDLPDICRLMPSTIAEPSIDEIADFVHQYKHVYIKPKNGSLGLGVHQVIYDPEDRLYYCRFRDVSRNRLRRYGSIKRLLKTQFPAGFHNMVIQQGISLLKYQNNPIDYRIHTNKNERGKWCITAIAAKIAGPGSVTTHVKSGGQVKSVFEIWEDLQLNKVLLEELKNTSLKLSKAIDETTIGNVGEIGFDIGIDEDEKIWMFEANSKPGRTIFSHPRLKREDQLTRKMPMDYALYLYQSTIESIYSPEEMLM